MSQVHWLVYLLIALYISCSNVARAQNVTGQTAEQDAGAYSLPLSSSNWAASQAGGNFIDAGTSGTHQIAMVLPKNSKHFELLLTGFQSTIAPQTDVSFIVAFDSGDSMSFLGSVSAESLQANLNDDDVAKWTHDMTADHTMIITFPNIPEVPWTIPLTGTTPTVTAMAKALTVAGIKDLPGPWRYDESNAETALSASQPNSPQTQPNQTNNQAQISQSPTFSDPQGTAYANSEETTWTTDKSYDEMTDHNDITITSEQSNGLGADAEVTGSCSNRVISFFALITDDSGNATVNVVSNRVFGVVNEFRINSEKPQSAIVAQDTYGNKFIVAMLSLNPTPAGADSNIYTGSTLFDVRNVWRILTKFTTDHGDLIVKIPLYNDQIKSLITSCFSQ